MQRVSELTIQAANDTLGAEDRAILAIEVNSLKDELFNLVNSRDLNGNYLFSETKLTPRPTLKMTVARSVITAIMVG